MKSALRTAYAIVLGFLQALLLAILLGCILKSEQAGALAFLFGWPVLAWRQLRRLRRAAAAGAGPASLARRAIWPLVAAPIVLAIPLFTLISAVDRGAGGSGWAAVITLAILSCVFVYCWGAAFMAFLVHLGTRNKP